MPTLTEKLAIFVLVLVALPLFWYMAKFGMNDIKDACNEIENNPDFGGLEIKENV